MQKHIYNQSTPDHIIPCVAAKHPTLSMGEMAKKLGELWKAASSEEKATYEVCDVAHSVLL